jgi:hypothetical protein
MAECEKAFCKINQIVGEDIVLKGLDFVENAGKIKLAVDSSYIAAGAVLIQESRRKWCGWTSMIQISVFDR